MKKLLIVLIGLIVLSLPASLFAAVAGSDHDMTGGGGDLCMSCHIPHNAYGDKLWFSTPDATYSDQRALCATCHDGTTASAGVGTVFDNNTLEQHLSVGGDCSVDGGCHDVHTQDPNGTGKFLTISKVSNTWCIDCHDATPWTGAEALGDHTAGITHFTDATFKCEQCHTPHGAVAQTTQPAGLTNPILLADNQPGAFYGAFCISCHNGTAPPVGTASSGGVASGDPFDYSEATADGTETKHPTTTTASAIPVGGCDACHDVHDPTGTAYGYLLKEDNTNSAYCVSCHDGTSAPGVGSTTHFTGIPDNTSMNSGLTPAMPWANQIDEDGDDVTTGIDWPTATANSMVCETCHSVHRQGFTGVDAEYFLRNANGQGNTMCTDCHTAN